MNYMEMPIKDYPTYAITTDGYIRDSRSHVLKEGHNHYGYRAINLCNQDGYKSALIHRLVAEAFIPNPNNFSEVDHIDRNPSNNNVNNLRWCDDYIQAQNKGTPCNNTTGYKNIIREYGYFRVVIKRNGEFLCRKRFMKLEDAIECKNSIYLKFQITN